MIVLQLSLFLRNASGRMNGYGSGSTSSPLSLSVLSLLQSNRKSSTASTSTSDRNNIRNRNGNAKNVLTRQMLIEPSSTDITTSNNLIITATAEPSLVEHSLPQKISTSQNSQYELSSQQFVYVILTR